MQFYITFIASDSWTGPHESTASPLSPTWGRDLHQSTWETDLPERAILFFLEEENELVVIILYNKVMYHNSQNSHSS